eukprot:TRINITY_DN10697_c0_g5_i1.p1 TRINITY_DN10697_c0_g5~~TRINITY_DN10697_c0_g5_i1.p1  ORF type:complete len:291 (+),score=8.49 TRINITY_DN10697_c0_g5_i1:157-1029(+)
MRLLALVFLISAAAAWNCTAHLLIMKIAMSELNEKEVAFLTTVLQGMNSGLEKFKPVEAACYQEDMEAAAFTAFRLWKSYEMPFYDGISSEKSKFVRPVMDSAKGIVCLWANVDESCEYSEVPEEGAIYSCYQTRKRLCDEDATGTAGRHPPAHASNSPCYTEAPCRRPRRRAVPCPVQRQNQELENAVGLGNGKAQRIQEGKVVWVSVADCQCLGEGDRDSGDEHKEGVSKSHTAEGAKADCVDNDNKEHAHVRAALRVQGSKGGRETECRVCCKGVVLYQEADCSCWI